MTNLPKADAEPWNQGCREWNISKGGMLETLITTIFPKMNNLMCLKWFLGHLGLSNKKAFLTSTYHGSRHVPPNVKHFLRHKNGKKISIFERLVLFTYKSEGGVFWNFEKIYCSLNFELGSSPHFSLFTGIEKAS